MSTLLTTKEAAAYLRCHVTTLYDLWHAKAFRSVKIGRSTRWPLRELDRYIERQTRGAK